jgi:hypothetical protein
LRADVVDPDDGDDLLELAADLVEHPVVAAEHEGHPGKAAVLGLADGKAVDVVAPGGEHARNVSQHARDVLDGGRKDVSHGCCRRA